MVNQLLSSGYRCDKLNRAVGGAKNSDHRFGAAADIHSVEDTYEANKELWDIIMEMYLQKNSKTHWRKCLISTILSII